MKLVISYDLPDKIREANTGFSLNRAAKKVLLYSGINTAFAAGINIINNAPPVTYLTDAMIYLGCHSSLRVIEHLICSEYYKSVALCEIEELSQNIGQINVSASVDDLLTAYPYKTEYSLDVKKGHLEEKKYINIPVSDAFGEREMSVVQEHTLGSKEYVLSLGSPEKQKVYSLGTKKMLG